MSGAVHTPLVERLRADLEEIQDRNRPLPWVVHSGSSYRRIASEPTRENGLRSFPDGNVLCGVIQYSDGHPDLSMDEDQLNALVRLVNALPEAADTINELFEAAVDAEWTLEDVVEHEELGEECPRLEGFELCGAECCEHSGCAVERLARVRAAIARAKGETQ
jgi:hypothetical protein